MTGAAPDGFFGFYELLSSQWQGETVLALVAVMVFAWHQFRSPALGLPALTDNRDLAAELDPLQLAPPLHTLGFALLYGVALCLGYLLAVTAAAVAMTGLAVLGAPVLTGGEGGAPALWYSLPVWLLLVMVFGMRHWPALRAIDARLRYALQRRACVPQLMPTGAVQVVADLCHAEEAFHPRERDVNDFIAACTEPLVDARALTAVNHTIAHKWNKLCFLRERLLRWCEIREHADYCNKFGAQLRDINISWQQIRGELSSFCEHGLIADLHADCRDRDAPNDDISGYIHQRLDDTLLQCYCYISHGIFSGHSSCAARRRAFAYFGLLVNVPASPLEQLATPRVRESGLLDNLGIGDDEPPGAERRGGERSFRYATAELVIADQHYVCSPIELSVNGAALHLNAPVSPGTPAELDIIGLPPIHGSIVRSADEKICIEFSHNPDSRRQLRHYLAAAVH